MTWGSICEAHSGCNRLSRPLAALQSGVNELAGGDTATLHHFRCCCAVGRARFEDASTNGRGIPYFCPFDFSAVLENVVNESAVLVPDVERPLVVLLKDLKLRRRGELFVEDVDGFRGEGLLPGASVWP